MSQMALPVAGIIKCDYPDREVFITATMCEVNELMTVEPKIIIPDVIARPRTGGQMLAAEDIVSGKKCI
ncbi:TPA: hypothetical protein O7139_004328 [Salmonella enterica]|nr:hypothetical protein [Salmonella enterica]HDC2562283.1 hypothetical protein [Salmonella enterica]